MNDVSHKITYSNIPTNDANPVGNEPIKWLRTPAPILNAEFIVNVTPSDVLPIAP